MCGHMTASDVQALSEVRKGKAIYDSYLYKAWLQVIFPVAVTDAYLTQQ